MHWYKPSGSVLVLLLCSFGTARAQQLEPRAYAPAPRGLHFVGLGTLYSSGGVVTDPTLPFENVSAKVYGVAPYYGQTFGFFGRLASATAAVPFGWADVTGDVAEETRSVERFGLVDSQLRFGVNILGCPAMALPEYMKRKPGMTVGASVTITAPTGQYDGSKLVNLGTNRWSCKPELGFAQPIGNWIFELFAGVWLFETNDDFYGGHVREQDPLASYQTHVVYNFKPNVWAAGDFTYYDGGSTTVDGEFKNDRQSNTRGGLTLSFPCGNSQSLRLTWARGVATRIGSSFQTFGIGWQLRWF